MKPLEAIRRHPSLGNRDFRLLLGDGVCHAIGMGGEQVIFSLLVYQLTGSSFWVGVAFALYSGPMLVVGVPAGAIADWLPRRTLLRAIQAAMAVNFINISLLVGLGAIELWFILALTFVSGAIRSTYQPVRLSYAVDLVGAQHAAPSLALVQIGNRVGQGIGALAAGFAMQYLGAESAYAMLAIAHFLGVLLLARLRVVGGVAAHQRSTLARTFVDYAAEMASNRALLALVMVTAGVNLFGFSFSVALPELATERLGVGAGALGTLHAARAVGGTAAMAIFAFWGSRWRLGTLFLLVLYAFAFALLLLAAAPTFAAALAALLVVAAMASLTDVASQTMMQLFVPDRLRGRAMGAWTFSIGMTPIGHFELGLIATHFGASAAIACNALGVLACAALASTFARHFERGADRPRG